MTETLSLAEVCQTVYGEPVEIIDWDTEQSEDKLEIKILFREQRRGWYFEMIITQTESGKNFSSHRVLPLFLPLLDPDETQWHELTQEASEADWQALDQLFALSRQLSETNIAFAGADIVGEEVADEAMDTFGFYVPDEELLPVFIWWNLNYQLKVIAYFKHPDRFAGEVMFQDDNTDECEVYASLTEAIARLEQKLAYYRDEA
ncbi:MULTISPECIES: hypothetical protein [Cyanophyceae]|uniref:hypothetical protein n=1 Tax=Cyanophyceae TaxID=3028117 RepID=UPI00016DC3B0|nr:MULTISPECIES: hypothetical protein [Cyanophyceae]ACB01070.1 hypothetical protein SYNPCC7002_G0030 [Picosynechococcus sp. PCC 7002]SMH47707.1 hypothetical protein SAMN06272755_1816 [Picosynechococcus sp. OG1]SMQ81071.1 hypothetical protein SAMN06272774_1095 [Synechococcus sp. 7002]